MTREAQSAFRERMRDWMGEMDMVSRDEFEAVKAIAVAAREENQLLKARIDALETRSDTGAASSGNGTGGTAGTAAD
jgi:BMFP domain-containing protein YqiC